jgi:glycine oxidase
VIATGARADLRVEGCPGLARLLHPVKGQILRLDQSLFPLVRHIVRTPDVYLVPKSSGMLVVGATTEERGFNEAITAGAVYDLLKAAWECLPGIYELPLIETSVGFRPATRDHLPILGAAGPANVSLALGYYRHGVLLAPIAARILANWLLRGERSAWLDQFSIDRFHTIESTP